MNKEEEEQVEEVVEIINLFVGWFEQQEIDSDLAVPALATMLGRLVKLQSKNNAHFKEGMKIVVNIMLHSAEETPQEWDH